MFITYLLILLNYPGLHSNCQHLISFKLILKDKLLLQKTNKFFILPPYTLKPLKYYILELTVSPSNKLEAKINSTLNITVIPSELYVYIASGNKIASV